MKKSQCLVVSTAIAIFTCLPLHATQSSVTSQRCDLGTECPIPGDDGGLTHFNVTPMTGVKYFCKVHANDDSLAFVVNSGKDFRLDQGIGYYKATPDAYFSLVGHFTSPDDFNDPGEIKFIRAQLRGSGSVICWPTG